jgi:hypothetical protein
MERSWRILSGRGSARLEIVPFGSPLRGRCRCLGSGSWLFSELSVGIFNTFFLTAMVCAHGLVFHVQTCGLSALSCRLNDESVEARGAPRIPSKHSVSAKTCEAIRG